MYCYVGSRTTRERNARGDGITVFKVDEDSGALERVQTLDFLVNPSYLEVNRDGSRLYCVHGDLDYVSAFAIDQVSGQLEFLNREATLGKNPVHLALDRDQKVLVVSNHLSSGLAVLPLDEHGRLKPVRQLLELEGPVGPHRVEQTMAKPHFNGFDPSGRFVVVPDKGVDRVFVFELKGGELRPAKVPFAVAREGAGPRHHVFASSGRIAYVVNELDSTVTVYGFDQESGELHPLQIASSLPDTFAGNSRSAGIALNADGSRLYVSNRGHDSIAVFEVDATTGRLRFMEAISTAGKKPRFFTLSPNGRKLFALNEDSDTIVAFGVGDDGLLCQAGPAMQCGSPVSMVFGRGT